MDHRLYEERIKKLERENRILKKKLLRSEANRGMLEEVRDAQVALLKAHNIELEKSRELIRESEERYRNLALHDPLTGLPNRILLQERLAQAIIRAKRFKKFIALLYIDLDDFKPVNDRFGHGAGDVALVEIANRLKGCIRGTDMVSRIGGDEFAMIIEDLNEVKGAGMVAKKVIAILSEPLAVFNEKCEIGASIGVSIYPLDGTDMDTLLQSADTAMYSSKKSGKNSCRFYSDLMVF